MKFPTLLFGSLCEMIAATPIPQCEAGDRLRAVADETEQHEHRECRQDGNESARRDPVVDEGARSEDDADRGGRAEGETAPREERHGGPEGEQDVEPERAARTVRRARETTTQAISRPSPATTSESNQYVRAKTQSRWRFMP